MCELATKRFRILSWVICGVAGLQVLSFAQAFHPLFDSLSHFRLHMLLFLCCGVAVLTLLRDWTAASLTGLVVVVAFASMAPALYGVARLPAADITLLQFNTRFDNATPEAILSQVVDEVPDLIALQEVSRKTSVILQRLEDSYPHQLSCPFAGVGGIALLSRHPIASQHCAQGSGLAWVRVNVGGKGVTVASLHLHWPWPYRQPQQIAAILPLLSDMPQPAVIAGDFNAAPWSTAVARVAAGTQTAVAPGLRLTLKRHVPGLGSTLVLPIDHVLIPVGSSADVRAGKDAGSDHLPLFARLLLPD
jgi:endonuclease/exonuclease/phosphatase (EEP) superfamily protein YafD